MSSSSKIIGGLSPAVFKKGSEVNHFSDLRSEEEGGGCEEEREGEGGSKGEEKIERHERVEMSEEKEREGGKEGQDKEKVRGEERKRNKKLGREETEVGEHEEELEE